MIWRRVECRGRRLLLASGRRRLPRTTRVAPPSGITGMNNSVSQRRVSTAVSTVERAPLVQVRSNWPMAFAFLRTPIRKNTGYAPWRESDEANVASGPEVGFGTSVTVLSLGLTNGDILEVKIPGKGGQKWGHPSVGWIDALDLIPLDSVVR